LVLQNYLASIYVDSWFGRPEIEKQFSILGWIFAIKNSSRNHAIAKTYLRNSMTTPETEPPAKSSTIKKVGIGCSALLVAIIALAAITSANESPETKAKREAARQAKIAAKAEATKAEAAAAAAAKKAEAAAAAAAKKAKLEADKESMATTVLGNAFSGKGSLAKWKSDKKLEPAVKTLLNGYLKKAVKGDGVAWSPYPHSNSDNRTAKYGDLGSKLSSAGGAEAIDARFYLQTLSKKIPPLHLGEPISTDKEGTCEISVLRAYYTDSHPSTEDGDFKRHNQKIGMLYSLTNNEDVSQTCCPGVRLENDGDSVLEENECEKLGPKETKHCQVISEKKTRETKSFTPGWHFYTAGKEGDSFFGTAAKLAATGAVGATELSIKPDDRLKLSINAYNNIVSTEQVACELFHKSKKK